jgi:hypothetical protein
MKRQFIIAVLFVALNITGMAAYSQEPGETDASVPALSAFHEVIYKIWHEAWPKKNTALLQTLQPDVEKGIAAVASARLPGILRDKKAAWDEGVRNLRAAGADYKAATAAKDDAKAYGGCRSPAQPLRVSHAHDPPPLAELDAFHEVLYMLYHHYLPKFDRAQIRKSAVELKKKMEALNQAVLPESRKDKDPEFRRKRAQLAQSVAALDSVVQSAAEKAIKEAVEKVHSDYQAWNTFFKTASRNRGVFVLDPVVDAGLHFDPELKPHPMKFPGAMEFCLQDSKTPGL